MFEKALRTVDKGQDELQCVYYGDFVGCFLEVKRVFGKLGVAQYMSVDRLERLYHTNRF